MKTILVLWLGSVLALHALPASSLLTFVSEPGFNVMTVTINPQVSGFSLADSDTTTLTGAVTSSFDIDPQAGTTSELTLSNGRVNGTNMNFQRFILFVGGYNLNVTDFSAALNTITPPGIVTPATGQFAANQHRFDIDQGAITGSTSGLIGANTINESFTPEQPASGTGTGTGSVVLTPAGESGIYRNFAVTLTLPIAINDDFDAGGFTVNVTATCTLKATGIVQVPRSAYLGWTVSQNLPGVSFRDDPDGDGIPHGIVWALGLAAESNARPHLPKPDPSTPGGFIIPLPPAGTAGPLLIESSPDLLHWSPATLTAAAANPLPAGATGTVSVAPDSATCRFIRLSASEP